MSLSKKDDYHFNLIFFYNRLCAPRLVVTRAENKIDVSSSTRVLGVHFFTNILVNGKNATRVNQL